MSVYALCLLGAVTGSAVFWARTTGTDDRLSAIYICAIAFGFFGAALLYLVCEGNLNAPLRELISGKSVIGGLLGGFMGVEISKRLLNYRLSTGDRFAAMLTIGIALGRVGCIFAECCPGIPISPGPLALIDSHGVARWPAPLAEVVFNLTMATLFFYWRVKGQLLTQHFHIYLISYGLFRLLHEFLRDSGPARLGYQISAATLIAVGFLAFHRRIAVKA